MFYARNNIFGPNCSVFVGNLSKTVAEATLFKTFNQVGVISSARVVRDPTTGNSLGQAYLNFVDPVDAERALKTMNGLEIDGQKIRIRRKKKETNLFIKEIPKEVTKQELEKAFEGYGKVASCRIMYDKAGNPLGYGYLRFANQEGADNAIDAAMSDEGIAINGTKLNVQYYQTWKERTHEMQMNEHFFTCLHIKGYPESWDPEEELKKILRGGIHFSVDIPSTKDGKNKKYCFVTFDTHEDAAECLKELEKPGRKKIDDEHELYVERLMTNFERQQASRKKYMEQKRENHRMHRGKNLYVKNFPLDWDKEQLTDLFGKYGTVTSAKVMRNSKEASKGFGFVCFENKLSATRAMEALNGQQIEGKPLCVNHAELKETRRQRLWGTPRTSATPRRGGYQRVGVKLQSNWGNGGWDGGRGGWNRRGRPGRGRRGGRGKRQYYREPQQGWMPMNVSMPFGYVGQ